MRIHRKLFLNHTECSDYCSGDPFADFYYPIQYPPPPPPPELLAAVGSGGGGGGGVSPSVIVLFVLLSSLLLLLLYYIVVAKFCFGLCDWARNHSSSGGDDGEGISAAAERHHHPIWLIATPGLHQSVINSIAVARYRRSDGLIDGTDCSVCLSEFRDGDSVRLLPKCSHAFHVACIDAWLRSHTNCPLCRAGIVVAAAAADHPAPAETGEAVTGSGGSGEIAVSDENDGVVRAVALGRSVSMDRGAVKVGQKREEKLSRMVRVSPVAMKKRSLSCGGIRFLSTRHSDADSILPL